MEPQGASDSPRPSSGSHDKVWQSLQDSGTGNAEARIIDENRRKAAGSAALSEVMRAAGSQPPMLPPASNVCEPPPTATFGDASDTGPQTLPHAAVANASGTGGAEAAAIAAEAAAAATPSRARATTEPCRAALADSSERSHKAGTLLAGRAVRFFNSSPQINSFERAWIKIDASFHHVYVLRKNIDVTDMKAKDKKAQKVATARIDTIGEVLFGEEARAGCGAEVLRAVEGDLFASNVVLLIFSVREEDREHHKSRPQPTCTLLDEEDGSRLAEALAACGSWRARSREKRRDEAARVVQTRQRSRKGTPTTSMTVSQAPSLTPSFSEEKNTCTMLMRPIQEESARPVNPIIPEVVKEVKDQEVKDQEVKEHVEELTAQVPRQAATPMRTPSKQTHTPHLKPSANRRARGVLAPGESLQEGLEGASTTSLNAQGQPQGQQSWQDMSWADTWLKRCGTPGTLQQEQPENIEIMGGSAQAKDSFAAQQPYTGSGVDTFGVAEQPLMTYPNEGAAKGPQEHYQFKAKEVNEVREAGRNPCEGVNCAVQ